MRIVLDPIKCEAHGLCAELLPERITIDEWGYPLIDGAPVPRALEDLARRAANACPTLAIKLLASEVTDLNGASRPPGRGVSAERKPAARGKPDAPQYQLYQQQRRPKR
jgi:ferredoxin